MANRDPRGPDDLLRTTDAALLIGIETRTLEKWRVTGLGPPFVKISNRAVRYRHKDLQEWVNARLRNSTSDNGRRKEA